MVLEDGFAAWTLLRQRQLTEQLKPQWQRDSELWADTTRDWRLRTMSQQFAKFAYERYLAGSVSKAGGWFADLVGNYFGSGSVTGATGDFARLDRMATPAAKGMGFDGEQAFRLGGIVNQPTRFAFEHGGAFRRGLMGEAGPEAIMPLHRGADGVLGVASAGGGPAPVIVNIINQTGTPATATASRRGDGGIYVLPRTVKGAIADDVASGQGDITSALQGRYNLRPAVG